MKRRTLEPAVIRGWILDAYRSAGYSDEQIAQLRSRTADLARDTVEGRSTLEAAHAARAQALAALLFGREAGVRS